LQIGSIANVGTASPIGKSSDTIPGSFALSNAYLKFTGTGSSNATDRGILLSGNDTIEISAASTAQLALTGRLTGTGTLVKTGPGLLMLSPVSNNSYGGGTVIKGGTISFGNDVANSTGLGTNIITLDGGTLSMYNNSTSYTDVTYKISIPAGSSGTFNTDSRCRIYGSLAGSGTLNVYLPGSIDRTIFFGDWSPFTGIINISGIASSTFRIANSNGYASAAINLNTNVTMYHGGTGNSGGDAIATNVQLGALSGQTGSFIKDENWTVGAKNTDAIFNGIISGASITKVGTGSWTLTGANTYTGGTTVNTGTLFVNNLTGSGTGTGAVTVNSGATLAGTGTISGKVIIAGGGTITPGNNGVGSLFINNSLLLASGSITIVEVNKSPLASDTIRTTGNLTYNGALNITNLSASAFAPGDAYKLFKAAGYNGSFTTITPATPGTGLVWDTTGLRTTGTIKVKGTQVITFDDLPSKKVGDAPFNLTATSSSGLPVSYTSSNTNVATISGSTVTIIGAGVTSITASQAGNTNYNAADNVTKPLNVTNTAVGSLNGQHIVIAPNPVNNYLTITMDNPDTKTAINIYSMNGALLLHQKVVEKKTIVPMEQFQPGSYIVKITTQNDIVIKQIIKL